MEGVEKERYWSSRPFSALRIFAQSADCFGVATVSDDDEDT